MTRRTMPYHRRYHGDALQGYMALDLEERGAYTTIIDLIYDRSGPIEFNEGYLAGMMNCSKRLVRSLVERLIAKGKLYVTADKKLMNRRCEIEIQAAISISIARGESAAKKGRKSGEQEKKRHKNNDPRNQMQIKRSAIALQNSNADHVIHSDPQDHYPTPGSSQNFGRTRRERVLTGQSMNIETEEISNDINENDEQMQNNCSVIPEPYIYNNKILPEPAQEKARNDLSHLADLLNRKPGRTPHPPSPAGRVPGGRH